MKRLHRYILERDTVVRSTKTALVVGTVLGVLNHYPALLARSLPLHEAVQVALTYLVPFSVATFGQVMGKRERDREGAAGSALCPNCGRPGRPESAESDRRARVV